MVFKSGFVRLTATAGYIRVYRVCSVSEKSRARAAFSRGFRVARVAAPENGSDENAFRKQESSEINVL